VWVFWCVWVCGCVCVCVCTVCELVGPECSNMLCLITLPFSLSQVDISLRVRDWLSSFPHSLIPRPSHPRRRPGYEATSLISPAATTTSLVWGTYRKHGTPQSLEEQGKVDSPLCWIIYHHFLVYLCSKAAVVVKHLHSVATLDVSNNSFLLTCGYVCDTTVATFLT